MQIEAVQDFVNSDFVVEFTSALWNSRTQPKNSIFFFMKQNARHSLRHVIL